MFLILAFGITKEGLVAHEKVGAFAYFDDTLLAFTWGDGLWEYLGTV